jgi:hypothetical protein
LPQKADVSLAQIRDEAPSGTRLEHSQAARNGEVRIARNATRFPFIQKNEIRRETLSQKNGAALACAEVLACPLA